MAKYVSDSYVLITLVCQLMEAGANGANGVTAQRQSVAYKQGVESALIQSQHMVEINAMETEQS